MVQRELLFNIYDKDDVVIIRCDMPDISVSRRDMRALGITAIHCLEEYVSSIYKFTKWSGGSDTYTIYKPII